MAAYAVLNRNNNMAFDKDPSVLQQVAPFGGEFGSQERRIQAARKERQGERGEYAEEMKLPKDHTRILRFIPGDYTFLTSMDDQTVTEVRKRYYTFVEHWHGGLSKKGRCSAGPLRNNRNLREPCHGCDIYWANWETQKDLPREQRKQVISMTERTALTVWDYGLWLKIPATARNGKTYTNWVPAAMNDPRVYQFEHKYGHLIPIALSKKFFWTLVDYKDKAVRNDCKTCGAQGTIRSMAVNCMKCGSTIYDPNTSVLSIEQREKLEQQPCPYCGNVGTVEVVTCSNCSAHGYTAARADIFDVDFELSASGSKEQPTLLISNRSAPRPIQVNDPEKLKTIVPLPLDKIFAPTSLKQQQSLWNVQGTPTPQQGGQFVPQQAQPLPPQVQQQPQMGYMPQQQPMMQGYMPQQQMPQQQMMPPQVPYQQYPQQQMMPVQQVQQQLQQPYQPQPVGLPGLPGIPGIPPR